MCSAPGDLSCKAVNFWYWSFLMDSKFYLRTISQGELPILSTRTYLTDQPLNAAKQKRISPWWNGHRFTDVLPNGNLEHLTLRSLFRPLVFDEQWMMNTPPFTHIICFSVYRRHKYLLQLVSNLGLPKKTHHLATKEYFFLPSQRKMTSCIESDMEGEAPIWPEGSILLPEISYQLV